MYLLGVAYSTDTAHQKQINGNSASHLITLKNDPGKLWGNDHDTWGWYVLANTPKDPCSPSSSVHAMRDEGSCVDAQNIVHKCYFCFANVHWSLPQVCLWITQRATKHLAIPVAALVICVKLATAVTIIFSAGVIDIMDLVDRFLTQDETRFALQQLKEQSQAYLHNLQERAAALQV